MISAANVITDLYLSLMALAGLFVLSHSLRRTGEFDPLTRRFMFGIRVTMMLFAGRALIVLTGGAGFRFVVLIAAALLPLAVLLLTEGLLRRHAPKMIKVAISIGSVAFFILAFVNVTGIDPWRLNGLLAFQLAGFGAAGWLVVTRDRDSLSAAENRMVGRLGLSLILLIPLIGADFLMVLIKLPIQLSALGVLALCWLAIGLGRAQAGHAGPIVSFVIVVAAAVGSGALLGTLAQLGTGGTVMAIAIVMAAFLLLAILNDANALRVEVDSHRLLQYMANSDQSDAMTFLRGLQSHPLVDGAIVIEAAQLDDLDSAILTQIFTAHPVLRKSDAMFANQVAQDHVQHLFDRFDATHILQITHAPRLLVALAMPALTAAPLAELELQAVQRMASLIAQRQVPA